MKRSSDWQIPNKWTALLILSICAGVFIASTWRPVRSSAAGLSTHFKEVSHESGISFVHSKPLFDAKLANVMPWMVAVGASASAADYENSGNLSVFLTNSGRDSQNALLRNEGVLNGVPHFRDVTAEVGLSDLNREGSCM